MRPGSLALSSIFCASRSGNRIVKQGGLVVNGSNTNVWFTLISGNGPPIQAPYMSRTLYLGPCVSKPFLPEA